MENKAKWIGPIVLLIIVLFFSSFRTIKSGQIGLRVRFGKIANSQLTEGINFKIPFVEKIIKVDIKVQKIEQVVESSTKDLQIINTGVAVNYHIDKTKATELYKTIGKDYANTVLLPAIKENVKGAIAKYTAEEITTSRAEVSASCLKAIQDKVAKYGIIIDDFNLTDFSFSAEYTKAIEQKQVAEQNLERARLEAEAKVTKAKGEADANKLLEETLTKEVLVDRYLEKWDGKLPKVTSDDTMFDISSLLGDE